nr:hypothetical protein [Planctomycetota bacterium]
GLIHARVVVPAQPGELALRFPHWVPGVHSPGGPVGNLGWFSAHSPDGTDAPWRRDGRDPWRFLVTVPPGADAIVIRLTYIADQPNASSRGVDVATSAGNALINWNCCLVLREDTAVDAQAIDAAVRLPDGWNWAATLTPLPDTPTDAPRFARMTVGDLVDRPLLAGQAISRWRLHATEGEPPVDLAVAATDPTEALRDERWLVGLRRLPAEAMAMFGGAFYDRYCFLLVLGGDHAGLEHGTCSYNAMTSVGGDFDDATAWHRELMPHEYVHSWVGKHRRPAGMCLPDYHSVPELDGLWIYEGLTEHLGGVLAVRAGLMPVEMWRDQLADRVHKLSRMRGRHWRSIRDTCRCAYLLREPSPHHDDLRRGQDFYTEGALFWLAADLAIRQSSGGERSLDDLCRAFFGPGGASGMAFTEPELIAELTRLAPDVAWAERIRAWIDGAGELDAAFVGSAGWQVDDGAAPADDLAALDRCDPMAVRDLIGLEVYDGYVQTVRPGTPAAAAGLAAGDFIHAFNDIANRDDPLALARALAESPQRHFIACQVYRHEKWWTTPILYRGGLRLSRLVALPGATDQLAAILAPRAGVVGPIAVP